jgi:hypothetical protein
MSLPTMDYQRFSAWLRERLGSNWVVAKRTKRVVERYGDDVVCVSLKRFAALKQEFMDSRYEPS